MSVFLRGVILSIPNCQFISNRSMMNVHLLSQESKLMSVNLQLNLCPSKSTTPTFSITLSKFTTMKFLGQ